jgi:hypothetical protein
MFVKCAGALYGDNNDQAQIQQAVRPLCILVKPDQDNDHLIDVGWNFKVEEILRGIDVSVKENGGYRPIREEEITSISAEMASIVPIGEVGVFEDDDKLDDDSKQRWNSSIPLRLARGVTFHKVQGTGLERYIMTPPNRRMFGTTFTGFSRAKGGLSSIVLAANFTNEFLIDHINNDPGDDFDLIKIDLRLRRMAQATERRFAAGQLFTPHAEPVIVGAVERSFEPRAPLRGRGSRGSRARGHSSDGQGRQRGTFRGHRGDGRSSSGRSRSATGTSTRRGIF